MKTTMIIMATILIVVACAGYAPAQDASNCDIYICATSSGGEFVVTDWNSCWGTWIKACCVNKEAPVPERNLSKWQDGGSSAWQRECNKRPPPPPPEPPPPPPKYTIGVSGPSSREPGNSAAYIATLLLGGRGVPDKTINFSVSGGSDVRFNVGTGRKPTNYHGMTFQSLHIGRGASGTYTITVEWNGRSSSMTLTVGSNEPTPPPPEPEPEPEPPQQVSQPTTGSTSTSTTTGSSTQSTSTSSSSSTQTSSSSGDVYTPPTVTEVVRDIERVVESEPDPEIEIEPEIEPEPEPEPEIILEYWEWQFYKGWNLVVFPVLPVGIETIADLYNLYEEWGDFNPKILVRRDNNWLLYTGDESSVGDITLKPHMAMATHLDWSFLVGVRGIAQPSGSIILQPGINMVGIPEVPRFYKRPSDLLSVDGIHAIIIERKGEFSLVAREGDEGDDLFIEGQGIIIFTDSDISLDLGISEPASAPRANIMLTTSWGAMKRR